MDDTHIKILEFALRANGPVTISEISKELGIHVDKLKWLNNEADTGTKIFLRDEMSEGEWTFSLSMLGRQILLEHEILTHARKSTRKAYFIATSALVVAIISILFNIIELQKFYGG